MNFKEWLKSEAVSYKPYNVPKFITQSERKLKQIESKYENFDYEKEEKQINAMIKDYCMSHERNVLYSFESILYQLKRTFKEYYKYSDFAEIFKSKGIENFAFETLERNKKELKERINTLEKEFEELKDSLPTTSYCGEEHMATYNKFINKYQEIKNDIKSYEKTTEEVMNFLKHKNHLIKTFYKTGGSIIASKRENMPAHEDQEIMYHATPMMKEILSQGFKTRDELEGLEVVGGGPADVISFTSNPQMAIKIANRIKTIIKIAKGIVTLDQIYEWGKNKKILNRDDLESARFYGGEETINKALYLYRLYISRLEQKNIGFDPLFFGVKKETLEKLDPDNVGVIQATIDMNQASEYLDSMEEYRVKKQGISQVKKYH